MQNTGRYTKLIIIALLGGMLTITPALSSLTDTAIIRNTGTISYVVEVTAKSGYWQDIQAAVDQVAAAGGIGNVYIPEGTFNFTNVDEGWTGARVVIPAGVNLFGAPTERTSGLPYDGRGMNPNDQVVEWRTILVIPWDAPSATLFQIVGSADPTKPCRFSDIKIVGYRSINSSSTIMLRPLSVNDVIDFRIDHCHFENMAEGMYIGGRATNTICGVVDHCKFINTNGIPQPYDSRTVGYGIHIDRTYAELWEPDIENVIGQYTDYSVYIEDSYFSKWRHCIASNNGAHHVFRYNTIKDDFGYGSLDAHGGPGAVSVGTRATEIYNNIFQDAIEDIWGVFIKGGGGVAFNNKFGGGAYTHFMILQNDHTDPTYWTHDWWIWDNDIGDLTLIGGPTPPTLNEDYFLRTPTMEQDGFEYQPYPYPHPLTK
jgi:hypothetical protein